MDDISFILKYKIKNICSYLTLKDVKNLRLINYNTSRHIINYMIKNYFFRYDKEILTKDFKLKHKKVQYLESIEKLFLNDHITKAIYKSEYMGNISTDKKNKYVLHIHIPQHLTHAYIDSSFSSHLNNFIEKMIRKGISSTLTYLDISQCYWVMNDSIYSMLLQFHNLTHLNILYNENIKNLHQVNHLKLHNFGIVHQSLELPPNILSLDLGEIRFQSNLSLDFLSDYKSLTSLKLPYKYNNNLTFLYNLPNLKILKFAQKSYPNIGNVSWDKLSLTSIEFENGPLDLNMLSKSKTIKYIYLKNYDKIIWEDAYKYILPINITELRYKIIDNDLLRFIFNSILNTSLSTRYEHLKYIYVYLPKHGWINLLPYNEKISKLCYQVVSQHY